VEYSKRLLQQIPATLIVKDLNAAVNPVVFPADAALVASQILQLTKTDTLQALGPKVDFLNTIGQLNPPRILLRKHHCDLLKFLRNSLTDRSFQKNALQLYGQFTYHARLGHRLELSTDELR
jgi:hypothetical protein